VWRSGAGGLRGFFFELHLDEGVAVAVPLDFGGGDAAAEEPVLLPVGHFFANERRREVLDGLFVRGEAKVSGRHIDSIVEGGRRAR